MRYSAIWDFFWRLVGLWCLWGGVLIILVGIREGVELCFYMFWKFFKSLFDFDVLIYYLIFFYEDLEKIFVFGFFL